MEASENGRLVAQLQEFASEGFTLYQRALELGVAREQARLFLPAWCSYYIAVCKVDAWNLMNFLRLRLAPDAQWEIRQFAMALHELFGDAMPWTSDAFDLYMLPNESSANLP
jgi:thymidylate synthase (FAD)